MDPLKLLIFFLILINFSFAQNQKKFFDEHENLQGIATFYGDWNDSILPLNWYFRLNWRNVLETEIETFVTKGYLSNHAPNNYWEWNQAKIFFQYQTWKNHYS